jgi:transposase
MIKIGELMTIETLHKQGASDRQIAKLLGISRNTVKKYIESDGPPRYRREQPYASVLDDFKVYLQDRLKSVPEVTAERLHRELTERGYQGSYPTVVNYVRLHRPDTAPEAFARYETGPGEWAQVDWGEFGKIEHYGVKRKVYCFSYVLCFSRAQYIEFTLSSDLPALLRCHDDLPGRVCYGNGIVWRFSSWMSWGICHWKRMMRRCFSSW